MYIIINGYGTPDNIMTDLNYNRYLGFIFNYLWANYRHKKLTITVCGGPTDMKRPYQRTEAGEMAKWFRHYLARLNLTKRWQVKQANKGLGALDNLLAAKKIIGSKKAPMICCFDITRTKKMRRLIKEVLGSKVKLLLIDFDLSLPRYDLATRQKMEAADLRFSLKALRDQTFYRKLQTANRQKIKILRQTPAAVRATEIDKISSRLRNAYLSGS